MTDGEGPTAAVAICVLGEQEQSDKIVNDLNDRLGRGFDRLESMKLSLIGVTAQASNMVSQPAGHSVIQ